MQECDLYTCEASYIRAKEMAQSSHEIKHAISGGLPRSVSVSTLRCSQAATQSHTWWQLPPPTSLGVSISPA